MARIPLVEAKEDLDEDRHEEFDAICEVLGHVRGPFSVLMRSPGLAKMVMGAGAHVRLHSTLTRAERELTILAVAREKDGAYEWSAHVGLAREAGVSEETIAAVRERGDTTDLTEHDRHIVDFVRQLLETNTVSDPLFASLHLDHGERWLVELTATIGQYQYISAINNVFQVLPHDGAEVLPARQQPPHPVTPSAHATATTPDDQVLAHVVAEGQHGDFPSKHRSIDIPGIAHSAPIPMGARIGGIVFSSAIMGTDPTTGTVPDDGEAQVALAFANCSRFLEVAGATPADVVRMTVHLSRLDLRPIVNNAWEAMFPDPKDRPARHTMTLQLAGNMAVQLEIVAVVTS